MSEKNSGMIVVRDVMRGGAILGDVCLPIDNLSVKSIFLDAYA
jgi:hypothetical protein